MKSLQVVKKKKRDKTTSNGADVDVDEQAPSKQVDASKGQLHGEQRTAEAVNSKKPFVSTSPSTVPAGHLLYTSHLYPHLHQWPFSPQQQRHMSNQSTHPHLQIASLKAQPVQGQQAGCQQGQVQQANQQLPGYWNTADYSAHAAAADHRYPFPPGSSDSNWPLPSFGSFQAGSNGLFGFPGAYGFPGVRQAGFPGPWDPSSWYGQQSAAAPAYNAYYGYGAPGGAVGVGSLGISDAVNKGLIKPPPGLSHKHHRLWEAQSVENVQMWTALARAEAEIAAQHNKILQLEADLQSLKPHQETSIVEVTAVPSRPSKRVRPRKLASQLTSSCLEGAISKSRGRRPSNGKRMSTSKGGQSDLTSHEETATRLDERNDFIDTPDSTKDEKVNCSLLIDMLKSVDEKSICAELNAELPMSTRGNIMASDASLSNDPLSETGKNQAVLYFETNLSHLDNNKDKVNGRFEERDLKSLLTKETVRDKDAGSDSCKGGTAVNRFSDAIMRPIPVDARLSSFSSHVSSVKVGNVSNENVMPSWAYAPRDASDEQDAGQDDDDDEVLNEDEEYALSENQEVGTTEAVAGRISNELLHLNGWKNL